MKIDLWFPEFPTWTWNYGYGFLNALKKYGYLGEILIPTLETDRRIIKYLSNFKSDMVICIGGGAYMKELYRSQEVKRLLMKIDVPKLLVLVESMTFSADDYKTFKNVDRLYHEPKDNSIFYTHIITCDEKDVEIIQSEFNKPSKWLPQCVDETMFYPKKIKTKYKLVFVGNPDYIQRKRLINNLKVEFEIIRIFEDPIYKPYSFMLKSFIKFNHNFNSLKPNDFFARKAYLLNKIIKTNATENYSSFINSCVAMLNLPTILKAYTSKVYETLVCGIPIFQPKIYNKPKNQALFDEKDGVFLYDPKDFVASSNYIKEIMSDPIKMKNAAEKGRWKVLQQHTCSKRLEEYIDFVKNWR